MNARSTAAVFAAAILASTGFALASGTTAQAAAPCSRPGVVINGTPGNDVLNGTPGSDVINGRGGNDVINGLGGSDVINGGAGNDVLRGGECDDRVNGGPGNDRVEGNAGNDVLRGNSGIDRLFGQDGRDRLDGGLPTGTLVGDSANGGAGVDACTDFESGAFFCPMASPRAWARSASRRR